MGRDLRDTVYVTANGIIHQLRENGYDFQFHHIEDVWTRDGWNDEIRTVPADTMTEYVLETHRQYPHKLLIDHYLQRHYPFFYTLDETHGYTKAELRAFDRIGGDFWDEIREEDTDIPLAVLWDAYD